MNDRSRRCIDRLPESNQQLAGDVGSNSEAAADLGSLRRSRASERGDQHDRQKTQAEA
jgi:hypothetical protein